MPLLLSVNRGIGFSGSYSPNVASSFLIHIAFLMAASYAQNSAIVDDGETKLCFLLCHIIGAPPYIITWPSVDLPSGLSWCAASV